MSVLLLTPSTQTWVYLLDIPSQPDMSWSYRLWELYQPIQSIHGLIAGSIHVVCLGTSKSVAIATHTGQHSSIQGSCCPVWTLQHNASKQLWLHVMYAILCSLQWGFSDASSRHSSSSGHGRGPLHNICSLLSSVSHNMVCMVWWVMPLILYATCNNWSQYTLIGLCISVIHVG